MEKWQEPSEEEKKREKGKRETWEKPAERTEAPTTHETTAGVAWEKWEEGKEAGLGKEQGAEPTTRAMEEEYVLGSDKGLLHDNEYSR